MKDARATLCLLLPLLCLVGCGTSASSPIHIVVSGDTAGWITPCGCTANQSGGLERRASLLNTLGAKDRVVYLDVGGSAAGKSEYQQVKLKSILNGNQIMGLEAHNVGAPETQLAPEVLLKMGQDTSTHWLSANLQTKSDHNSSKNPFDSYRIVVRNGIRILVTGVVDPLLIKNPAWTARDASSSVLDVVKREKADLTVVLAYMDEPGLRALAESLPEVDFIIGGPTGQLVAPSKVGPVEIMSATNKGKFLVGIELEKSGKAWHSKKRGAMEVTSTLPRDPSQTKNLDDYLSTLAARDFAAAETGLVTIASASIHNKSEYQVAGTQACVSCHQQDDTLWHASKHSHAWQTLIDKRSHVDPSCQQCHTTGYGIPGGFEQVAKSTQLVNVGCESCHGPSQSHALNPKTKTTYLSREQCVRCHDHENSPEFDFTKYWEKIVHGQKTN